MKASHNIEEAPFEACQTVRATVGLRLVCTPGPRTPVIDLRAGSRDHVKNHMFKANVSFVGVEHNVFNMSRGPTRRLITGLPRPQCEYYLRRGVVFFLMCPYRYIHESLLVFYQLGNYYGHYKYVGEEVVRLVDWYQWLEHCNHTHGWPCL